VSQAIWQEHALSTPDLELAWYDAGQGPVIVFLSGGPGDDHRYLRRVAEPLIGQFRCVLCDQRGTGRSQIERYDETTLHIDRFLADLDALRIHLDQPRLALVGHSWGALLALFYGMTYPQRVERLALIGMGPFMQELSAVARANTLQSMTVAERGEFARLAAEREVAARAHDWERFAAAHIRMAALRLRSHFYSPEIAARFYEDYRATYGYNPQIAPHVLPTTEPLRQWDQLERISAPVLILYGYQDFEPITQAYLMQARMPQARIVLLNECGHCPWWEQPDAFYQALTTFLLE
jgi:proline iminopeptidase